MGVSFFALLCEFSVFGFVFHHLDFVLSGAAVLRLKGSAAGFVMRCLVFCQERIGASDAGF